MAAPGTAPERFVRVGADSDAAPSGGAPNVPKKYGRAERARSFRISRGYRGQVTPGTAERPYPIQTGTWCRYVRGSGIQGTRGSEFTGFRGQDVLGFRGLREIARFRMGGGDWEFEWGPRTRHWFKSS